MHASFLYRLSLARNCRSHALPQPSAAAFDLYQCRGSLPSLEIALQALLKSACEWLYHREITSWHEYQRKACRLSIRIYNRIRRVFHRGRGSSSTGRRWRFDIHPSRPRGLCILRQGRRVAVHWAFEKGDPTICAVSLTSTAQQQGACSRRIPQAMHCLMLNMGYEAQYLMIQKMV